MSETKSRVVRCNFTMPEEDAERIKILARLITPAGEEPNSSLAVRVAIREAIESRKVRRRRVPE
jgi:hypothetical protein